MSREDEPRKRPYRRPRLVVYGDFRALTGKGEPAPKGGITGDGMGNPATKI